MAKEKEFHIYSRLANAQRYATYVAGGADLKEISHRVHVAGGAGLMNKNLITPQGVRSGPFTEHDIEMLKQNKVFQLHKENGFITVEEGKAIDVDTVVSDMGDKVDPSFPLSDSDYKDANGVDTPGPETVVKENKKK
jgi:hypothetical protein